jgi:hypothetical protein
LTRIMSPSAYGPRRPSPQHTCSAMRC